MTSADLAALLGARARSLLQLMDASALASYDYFDLWATPAGQRLKQWSYRAEPLGTMLFGGPVLAAEIWAPQVRQVLGLPRRRYAITVAQHGLACLALYRQDGRARDLAQAEADASLLVEHAIPGVDGLAWGFPFPWSSNSGVVAPDQPAATQSAYALDLFEGLFDETSQSRYRDHVLAVARAMRTAYSDLPRGEGRLASTYHGHGQGDVVLNSVSYRIHCLAAGLATGDRAAEPPLRGLIAYALAEQRPDGAWYYGESPKNRFIDHYHTCFVLKNLERAARRLGSNDLKEAVARGAAYYWEHLFDRAGLPTPFAEHVRANVVRYELYDFAECLGLFALLGPDAGFDTGRLETVLSGLDRFFRRRDGGLRFRVYRVPAPGGYTYFRNGTSATTLALAQLAGSALVRPPVGSAA